MFVSIAKISIIFENSKLSDDFLMADDERSESQRWTAGRNFLGAGGTNKGIKKRRWPIAFLFHDKDIGMSKNTNKIG
jgi:hypothetical protein